MHEPNMITVVLELQRDADPIAGRLRAERRAPRPFTGWLQLTSVLAEELAAHATGVAR